MYIYLVKKNLTQTFILKRTLELIDEFVHRWRRLLLNKYFTEGLEEGYTHVCPLFCKFFGEQGNQIGRTFAYWAIVTSSLKIADVAIFWEIFSETHLWSPSHRATRNH
jgi:hypothetical protein